jgi:hypothetical protein
MHRLFELAVHTFRLILIAAVLVWSFSAVLKHDPSSAQLPAAAVAAELEHGHIHGDAIDALWVLHGHAHDVADHDHNWALTPTGNVWVLLGSVAAHLDGHEQGIPALLAYTIEHPPRA